MRWRKLKDWFDIWENEHFKRGVYAVAFVAFILVSLYFLSETIFLVYFHEISAVAVGLFFLLFPKYAYDIWDSLSLDKKPYTNKEERHIRLGGIVILLIPVIFYILDKYIIN